MSTQSTLRADIEAELEFEPSLVAANVGVAVGEGVATLTGHVASYAQKLAAESAAGRVKGVKAIVEKIEVRLSSAFKHDDEEIAKRVLNVLDWNVFLPANAVHIKVEKGWVTMTGDVDWRYQKEAAKEAVRKLSGIGGVSDMIKIRHRVVAEDVRDRIAQAYRRNAEFDSTKITVGIDGGKVTLTGNVRAWRDRGMAENAAWAIPGVTDVVDNLMVL